MEQGANFFRVVATTEQESDQEALSHDIPSYQEMFGDLDYIDCDHCGSIFGPAAYFVDLMRIVDQYITEPNQESISKAGGLTLNERRLDLAEIELTCENTNTLVPSLQIINRILEARVKRALDNSDGLQSLATVTYPFNLPFNFPLEQIRSYLGHLKTDLATIYETFGVDELAIAREYIGLSLEEYNLITNSQTNEEELNSISTVVEDYQIPAISPSFVEPNDSIIIYTVELGAIESYSDYELLPALSPGTLTKIKIEGDFPDPLDVWFISIYIDGVEAIPDTRDIQETSPFYFYYDSPNPNISIASGSLLTLGFYGFDSPTFCNLEVSIQHLP